MAGVRMSRHHAVFPRGYRTGRLAQSAIYWLAMRSRRVRAFFDELPPSRLRVWFVARFYHRLMENMGNGNLNFGQVLSPDAELTMFLETYVGPDGWREGLAEWLTTFGGDAHFELIEFVSAGRIAFMGAYIGGRGVSSGLAVEDRVYYVLSVENGMATRGFWTQNRAEALEAAGLSE